MHRLRQIKAYALGEVVDKDTLFTELEESYVPISSADCRICPDPCDEGIFNKPPFSSTDLTDLRKY